MKVSHCTEVFAKRSMTQSAAVIPSKCMQNLLLVWQFWKKTYHLANFIFLFFIVFNGCLQIRWTCFFWTRRIKGISVCRGLVMPGATAWLYAPYQILVAVAYAGHCDWMIRCLRRHNMTSYSRLQTHVFAKFVDTSILLYTLSPYSLLYSVSL